ncbi:hypothetical protein [Thermogutta sp.]|uniref:hypothetical protein n=1 Tax=Thermogutta sp. TaxID=1962930 RepID=UPI00321FBA5B
MKRERRQELKENELAELIGRWLEKIAPYSQAILVGLLAVIVLYVGWIVWANWARAVEQNAWNALYAALESGGPADLEAVAEQYPRTDAGHWARLLAADLHLRFGCQEMLSNKANAAQELRKAVDGYLAVRGGSGSPFFQQRVLWGLARAYEALSGTRQGQGELESAIKIYQELVDRWPDGPYAELARRRIAFLSKPENRKFYDMFAAYEPPKSTPGPEATGNAVSPPMSPGAPDVTTPKPPAPEGTAESQGAQPQSEIQKPATAPSQSPGQLPELPTPDGGETKSAPAQPAGGPASPGSQPQQTQDSSESKVEPPATPGNESSGNN